MHTPRSNMAGDSDHPKLALIAGPTASGKSALALALAEKTNGVIINADASQVYADLHLLSARPSEAEMARAPHHLFGYIDGQQACSAARWAADARQAIADAQAAGRLPILVGGTGLYIRTLLDGIAPIPDIDPAIRQEVRALPVAETHAALMREDPGMATQLAPTDTTRLSRALEVIRSTGRSISDWRAHKVGGIGASQSLTPLILLPPRDWLIARCNRRFEAMVQEGAVEEVQALLARALPLEAPVMRAIGVPEIAAWLTGEIDQKTMISRAQIATRQYAKRQYTWFSRQPPPHWPRHEDILDDKKALDLVIKLQHELLT